MVVNVLLEVCAIDIRVVVYSNIYVCTKLVVPISKQSYGVSFVPTLVQRQWPCALESGQALYIIN